MTDFIYKTAIVFQNFQWQQVKAMISQYLAQKT